MLAVTVGLGIWQIERLHWKEGLLAEIDRAEAAPPVPLPADPVPFEKVAVTGTLRDDLRARYGSEVRSTMTGPQLGAQVVEPLERDGASAVLVDLGWAPDGASLPQRSGPVTITGYVRPAERASWLTPSAQPSDRRFFALDPVAIGAALGLPGVAPFTVVALGTGDAIPQPALALPRPPNDHLGYALTWFGLAVCLLGVFAAHVRRVRKQ